MLGVEVHELLQCLAGYESGLFLETQLEDHKSFVLSQDRSGVSSSERAQLNKLAHLAYVHACVREEILTSRYSKSGIVRAITRVVDKHLRGFVDFVVDCEDRILKSDDTLVIGGQTSLVKLFSLIHPFQRVLCYLKKVSTILCKVEDAAQTNNAVSLTDELRLDCITGFPDIRPVIHELLSAAEGVIIRQIQTWSVYGSLLPGYEYDFFVHHDKASGLNHFTASRRPQCITLDVANLVFRTGLIKANLHKEIPLYSQASLDTSLLEQQKHLLSQVVSPINSDDLSLLVTKIDKLFSAKVLTKVLPITAVADLMGLLRSYYLIENGEFALDLIERAERDFRRTQRHAQAHLKSKTLQAILSKTLLRLAQREGSDDSGLQADESLLFIEIVPEDQLPEKSVVFDFLFGLPVEMKLHLSWPLNIVLNDKDLSIYSTIFNFLISVRRSEQQLTDMWRDRRQEIQDPRITRSTWSTLFRTLFFLQTLSEHYHASLIRSFSNDLKSFLLVEPDAYDPSAIADAHRRLLRSLMKRVTVSELFLSMMRKLIVQIDFLLVEVKRIRQENPAARCHAIALLLDAILSELGNDPELVGLLIKLQVGTGNDTHS